MRWIAIFFTISAGLFALGYGVFWAIGGFAELGFNRDVVVAAATGVVMVSALAAALMALIFYSARSENDTSVHHLTAPPDPLQRGAKTAFTSAFAGTPRKE